ncbi:MAG: SCP2 sterol-binding domain-containing protein [Proteobacteria bacterium]|nr:SCP2 sterol-binding domain-containing protein [Pseudomonadota bacterium]
MPDKINTEQQVQDPADQIPAHEQLLAEEQAPSKAHRDGDHETWTNQPAGAAAPQEEPLEEELDDEYDNQPVARKLIQNGRDVLCDELPPLSSDVTLTIGEGSDSSTVECIVSLNEQSLMAVRSGDLNPQVAMLSDKIRIKGKVGMAVYLFNLVAPRERSQ